MVCGAALTEERFVSLSAPDDELTLLELTDRLLNRGVVLTGDAVISVAGVDLIYLGLNVVLTAVENLRHRERTNGRCSHPLHPSS